ncbi:Uncharacterised protein [Mycolicibacterium vanbaalenii]|uniref:Uncharacterized protein n=1 Tax=Mycolicibacterium vanbaalenii TaxID=110539 RepID=A0A5S9R3T1_MYCVN|nr:hypothetical protein [Mycolicibacterium vanbaalenii]CAA0129266.1 Uncharacterised protein [Mycolicibacterium vanbaalenii]
MTATETWTLQAVDYRGGVVGQLDIKAECTDGRSGIITMTRWPSVGWRAPLHLNLPPKMEQAVQRVAREAVELGMVA